MEVCNRLIVSGLLTQIGQCSVFLWFRSRDTLVDLRDLPSIANESCTIGVDFLTKFLF